MATAQVIQTTVYDDTTDSVLQLTGGSDATYRMTVLPYDQTSPAVVSIWAKTLTGTVEVAFTALGYSSVNVIEDEWTRVEIHIDSPSGEYVDITPMSDTSVLFYKCMVENRATRASDWSPAPEDADEDISRAQETADDAQADIITLNDDLDSVQEAAEAAMQAIKDLSVGGVNLIDNSEKITLVGVGSDTYITLASDLVPETVYTLSASSAILKAGSAVGMTLEAVRASDSTVLFSHTLDFSGGHQKHTFTTGNDNSNYSLRLYAGIKGSCYGVEIYLEKVKLETGTFATMWTESRGDTEQKILSLTSQLTQTNKDLTFYANQQRDMNGTITNVNSFFRFDGSNPDNPKLVIGSSTSPMSMELSNSRLSFLWHGLTEVAYFSDNKLYITNVEAIQSLSIGTKEDGFLMMVTTSTGVGFVWRQGDALNA